MAGPLRYRDPGLIVRLRQEGHRFEFFQAVRLLRLQARRVQPAGREEALRPAADPVRYRTPLSLAFPASEIQGVSSRDDDGEQGQTELTVNFMGLTGPSGVLPRHYTEWLIARQVQHRDGSAHAYLELFNHRLIELFYQAWEKYRCHIAFERDGSDRLTRAVQDLVGVGFQSLQQRLAERSDTYPARALLFYSGILNQRPLAPDSVARLLAEFFAVPVVIRQFLPDMVPLDAREQSRLGMQRASLGKDTLAGERMKTCQSRLRVRIGPMSLNDYQGFLPGGHAHPVLKLLLQFCWGVQYALEVQLVLRREDVAAPSLGKKDAPLGWSGWLQSSAAVRDAEDACFSLA